eukprot:CAMPEP_0177652992 /NCGR_PEP_ID=MMETSP0447-20121125/13468_1 /TAXON_ID=0 /ORGANISM="Stygamoeba regulata, Strain BSH-02190019" /LENGTH=533 /DNA_ID=CAMNT_0019156359 /DNA_START=90 /DNA_END=1688 /DNA_ORIENTATION=+
MNTSSSASSSTSGNSVAGTSSSSTHPGKGLRIAVIGAGIAGLSCGWILGKAGHHHVTLFERSHAGLNAFTYEAPLTQLRSTECADPANNSTSTEALSPNNEDHVKIDVPFRVHIPSYYPNLTNLCRLAGVAVETLRNTTTISHVEEQLCWGYRSLNLGLYSVPWLNWSLQNFRWSFLKFIFQFYQFRRDCARDAHDPAYTTMTIAEYFNLKGYGERFLSELVYPFLSAACTCSYDAVGKYPAHVILNYFLQSATRYRQWRRFSGGSTDLVKKLEAGFDDLCYNVGIASVEPISDEEIVKITTTDGEEFLFDHVVICTPPNTTRQMLSEEHMQRERELLKAFEIESSSITIHNDASLFVADQEQQSKTKFSVFVSTSETKPMIHLTLNRVYPALKGKEPLYETWNCWRSPVEGSVKAEAKFERPLVTLKSEAALRELLAEQGKKRVWFAGSYSTPGCVPLLEGGVLSAATVTRQLGVSLPWQADYSSISEHSRALVTTEDSCKAYSASKPLPWSSLLVVLALISPLVLAHKSCW